MITVAELREFAAGDIGDTYRTSGINGFYLFRAKRMVIPRMPGRPDPLGPSKGIALEVVNDSGRAEAAEQWIAFIWNLADAHRLLDMP